MKRKIKAHIKGSFREAIATVIVDSQGNIEEVIEIEDFDDFEDCEVKAEIYQIGDNIGG
jgi:hypothetical protein